MDSKSSTASNADGTGTARRVTSQQTQEPKSSQQASQTQTAKAPLPPVQQKTEETPPKTTTTTTAQQPSQQKASTPAQTPRPASGGNKTARIRYVVPPIARPMPLRIEITDPSGKRDIMNRQVRSGESINTTASYTQECVITMYLGGEFVWQERQR